VFHVKQGYFITGTGTGVGKTFVTAALARRARELGRRVMAYKPIETGCRRNENRLIGEDQELLAEAAGGWQTGPMTGLYQFEPPVAPAVAAQRAHVVISIPTISTLVKAVLTGTGGPALDRVDLLLVEGAGGWRVPITNTQDMGALAAACGLPVIVAAAATLGTINHSLLTIEAVERDGQTCVALVLSQHPRDDLALVASNVVELRARWPGQILVLGSDATALDPLLG